MNNMESLIQAISLILFTSVRLVQGDHSGLCQFKGLPTHDMSHIVVSVCDNMVPRNGLYPPQKTTSPWKIFTYRDNIEHLHTQPVTLGSEDGKFLFHGYVVTARALDSITKEPTNIIGHFEHQWDASPVCCGDGIFFPNMIESSTTMIKLPNQTVLWTAPPDYEGPYIFIATIWRSSRFYWADIRSNVMTVIPRKVTSNNSTSSDSDEI